MTTPELPPTALPSLSSEQGHHLRPPPTNIAEGQKLCIDEMLQRHCGEFGKWQLKHFILTNLAWTLYAFHSLVMVFADRQPRWRCLAGAAGEACRDATASDGGNMCKLQPGSWEWVEGRHGATVSEWELICGQRFKVGLVQALFFGGCMIGLFPFYYDKNLIFDYFEEVVIYQPIFTCEIFK